MEQIEANKIIAGWELYKMINDVPGAVVECGVYKGASLLRLAFYRNICDPGRKLIGFDTFGKFPEAKFKGDITVRENFIRRFGETSSSADEIRRLMRDKEGGWAYLIEGDICQTVPEYIKWNSNLKIALLNMDVDLYEPAKVILENLYPLLSPGGILLADDYNIFPGETKAVDEFCQKQGLEINTLPLFRNYYIKKN